MEEGVELTGKPFHLVADRRWGYLICELCDLLGGIAVTEPGGRGVRRSHDKTFLVLAGRQTPPHPGPVESPRLEGCP